MPGLYVTGDQAQGFMHARQALCQLSSISSPTLTFKTYEACHWFLHFSIPSPLGALEAD